MFLFLISNGINPIVDYGMVEYRHQAAELFDCYVFDENGDPIPGAEAAAVFMSMGSMEVITKGFWSITTGPLATH